MSKEVSDWLNYGYLNNDRGPYMDYAFYNQRIGELSNPPRKYIAAVETVKEMYSIYKLSHQYLWNHAYEPEYDLLGASSVRYMTLLSNCSKITNDDFPATSERLSPISIYLQMMVSVEARYNQAMGIR